MFIVFLLLKQRDLQLCRIRTTSTYSNVCPTERRFQILTDLSPYTAGEALSYRHYDFRISIALYLCTVGTGTQLRYFAPREYLRGGFATPYRQA